MELRGCRFADLYAGTGAVGIEAISRGATHCWFGEKAAPALKSLRGNLAKLGVSGTEFTVEEKGAGGLLGRFQKLGLAMDLVFIDPPYEAEGEYSQTLGALGRGNLLAAGGLVIVEFATKGKFKLAERYGALVQTRVYKQGETSLAFYGFPAVDDVADGGNAPPE